MIIYELLTLFCSFLYGASSVLCKIGLQYNSNLRSYSIKNIIILLIKNKIWLLGVFISIFSNIIIAQVQSVIDISIVYPILNFSYIFTLLLGYLFLKESLNKNQWLAIIIVTLGTAIILFVKNLATGDQTDINDLIFLTFISIISIVILIIITFNNRNINYEIIYAICAGISFGNVETYLKVNTNLIINKIGYFSIFSFESVGEFLMMWPFLVLISFSIIGFICIQVSYSHGNVSITVPIIAVIQRIINMISGYLIFGEHFPSTKIIGFITIVLGIFILIFSSLNNDDLNSKYK
jgi:Predicted permeases